MRFDLAKMTTLKQDVTVDVKKFHEAVKDQGIEIL
jgi:hypothetical protein